MNAIYTLLTFTLLSITGINTKDQNNSQQLQKNTILDHYLNMPAGSMMCDNYKDKDSKEYRLGCIVRMDVRNGYLLSYHNDLIWMQVALFTYNEKNIVAAIASCGMGCMCNQKVFYEIQTNGEFKDVTADIIPKEYEDAGWFILPEKGTTIGIYDYDTLDRYDFKTISKDQQKALKHELIWEKGKFKLKQ